MKWPFKGVIFIYICIARLPIKLLYFIGSLLILTEALPFNPLKTRLNHNIRKLFPHKNKKEVNILRRKVIKSFGQYAAEFIKFVNSPSAAEIIVTNPEILINSINHNQFTFCVSGHFTGFEFFTCIPQLYKNCKFLQIYEADINLKELDDWMRNLRNRGGASSIPSSKIYREIIRLSQQKENKFVVGGLTDLKPEPLNSSMELNFLNEKINILDGIFIIGRKVNANFLYVKLLRKERGKYEATFESISDTDSLVVIKNYYNLLEKNILDHPEMWLPIISTRL